MPEDKAEISRLKELLEKQESDAKMLVRRDLELMRANEKLQELDQMKSEFMSVVAHQLRTPLSATKWALDMLVDADAGALSQEQKSILDKARQSNERMIHIVGNLLYVDLADSGKMQYKFANISLGKIIETTASELEVQAKQHEVTMSVAIHDRDIPMIAGDEEKMRAAVQNLLENAIKYTPAGGKVVVSVSNDPAGVKVAVSDTGIGIPKSEQNKLFRKFYRGANAISTETNGSGLGLFFVQKIVKRHGGTISFESEEGVGTTFTFIIPAAKQQ